MPNNAAKLAKQETFKCDKCDKEFPTWRGRNTHIVFYHISKAKKRALTLKRQAGRDRTLQIKRGHLHDSAPQNHNSKINGAEILSALILKRDVLNETIEQIRIMLESQR